ERFDEDDTRNVVGAVRLPKPIEQRTFAPAFGRKHFPQDGLGGEEDRPGVGECPGQREAEERLARAAAVIVLSLVALLAQPFEKTVQDLLAVDRLSNTENGTGRTLSQPLATAGSPLQYQDYLFDLFGLDA